MSEVAEVLENVFKGDRAKDKEKEADDTNQHDRDKEVGRGVNGCLAQSLHHHAHHVQKHQLCQREQMQPEVPFAHIPKQSTSTRTHAHKECIKSQKYF